MVFEREVVLLVFQKRFGFSRTSTVSLAFDEILSLSFAHHEGFPG